MQVRLLQDYTYPPTPSLPIGTVLTLGDREGEKLCAAGVAAPFLDVATLKSQMTAAFETLPADVRAAFRPLKTAVLDAINDSCFDELDLLIGGAEVPPELEPVRAQLLKMVSHAI